MQHPSDHPPTPRRVLREARRRIASMIRDDRPGNSALRAAYSVEALPEVTLTGVDTVALGVTLHELNGDMVIRVWTLASDGYWIPLLDETSTARVYTTALQPHGVRFVMEILDSEGLEGARKVAEVRVFEPVDGGKMAWYHPTGFQTAELTMVLDRDHDGMGNDDEDVVKSQFVVRVLDEFGKWWGYDPYVEIVRKTDPPTDTTGR